MKYKGRGTSVMCLEDLFFLKKAASDSEAAKCVAGKIRKDMIKPLEENGRLMIIVHRTGEK